MASGCILGKCCICDELIWEDEEVIFYDGIFFHTKCTFEIDRQIILIEEKLNILNNLRRNALCQIN